MRTAEWLDDNGYVFLLDDTLDAWENWTTHFKIYADRATFFVGVFEHVESGHESEAGYLDHREYRAKTFILKRRYPAVEPPQEPFDGMLAHFTILVDRCGQYEREGAENESPAALEESLHDAVRGFLQSLP